MYKLSTEIWDGSVFVFVFVLVFAIIISLLGAHDGWAWVEKPNREILEPSFLTFTNLSWTHTCSKTHLPTKHYTLHIAQCTLHITNYTLLIEQCVQYTLNIAHHSFHTDHCTLQYWAVYSASLGQEKSRQQQRVDHEAVQIAAPVRTLLRFCSSCPPPSLF